MVRGKVRTSRIMENYESPSKKKEIIRDEVYQLVETITTKYNEEVGDIGEIDPITKVGLGRDFNAYITRQVSRNCYRVDAADCAGPSI